MNITPAYSVCTGQPATPDSAARCVGTGTSATYYHITGSFVGPAEPVTNLMFEIYFTVPDSGISALLDLVTIDRM